MSKKHLQLTSNETRYSFLLEQLDHFSRKKKSELVKTEEKKLHKLQWTIENLTTSEEGKKLDWVPSLNLKKEDRSNILNDEELYDLHVTTAMNLLQKDHPIIVQPPSLMYAPGFDYCPFETVQVVHNGAHHLLLLSSMEGTVSIYDLQIYF